MIKRKYKAALILTAATVLAAAAGLYFACDNPVTSEEAQQPPRNLQASFTGAAVKLSWEPSERNEETGYEAWRSQGNNTSYQRLAGIGKDKREYADGAIERGKTYFYKVRTVYGSDPGEFSNEITANTFYLYHADSLGGKIYKIDASNGSVVVSFDAPGVSPFGLAWDGKYLWNADYEEEKIYKIDSSTGVVVGSFNSPDTTPRGLAWDGICLWNVGWDTEKIYRLQPNNGSVVASFGSPGRKPSGLTWDGKYLRNADDGLNKIYKINSGTGSVVSSFDSPGYAPKGLAWDGNYLWNVCGTYTVRKIYRLDPNNGSVVASFGVPGAGPTGLALQR